MKKSSRDLKEASKAFLNAEKGPGSSGGSSSSSVQDLIKCFCGICESFFKRPTIEYALKANGEEIMRDPEARDILRKFLIFRRGSNRSKSPAFEAFELFELCDDILQNQKNMEESQNDLEELLFTEYWENKLIDAIENNTLNDFLHDVQRDCTIRLENMEDFALLKTELRKKLK